MNRVRLRVEVDAVDRVAAGQDETLAPSAAHGCLQQVKCASRTDIDYTLAVFLAGCQMQDRILGSDQPFHYRGVGQIDRYCCHPGDVNRGPVLWAVTS